MKWYVCFLIMMLYTGELVVESEAAGKGRKAKKREKKLVVETPEESPALECVPRKVARASTGSRVTDRKALEERMAADGWTKEEKQREGSTHVDKYYLPPNGGRKLNSLVEVARTAYPSLSQRTRTRRNENQKSRWKTSSASGSSRRAPSSFPGR